MVDKKARRPQGRQGRSILPHPWSFKTTMALALPLSLAVGSAGSLWRTGEPTFEAQAATLAPRLPAPPGALSAAEYQTLLQRYVDAEGRVDYAALKAKDADTVERLYAVLAATGPDKTPELYKEKGAALAYYLSAYNLLVWKNIIDSLPKLKQVDEGSYRFFNAPSFKVDGKEVTLDELEKKIIRPRFKDGRIHFALNCASGGCPKLPRTAFTAAKVEQQLDAEAKRFCNEPRNVRYDAAQKTVALSMIFKWYQEDFGGSEGAVLTFINRYRAPADQVPAGTAVKYVDYDWRMNDKALPVR